MPGTLYIVATPIGNLEDITLRALRVLKDVDLIACEDTRQTRKLLTRYEIRTPTISYHQHNERQRSRQLMSKLKEGTSIALVTDAGAPTISDPGLVLIQAAIAEQIPIVPIPGPSALTTALMAAGVPTDRFLFVGFLPPRRARRRRELMTLASLPYTLVFFEAPHRIRATVEDMLEILGDRPAVLARELTKVHEEFRRARLSRLRRELEEQSIRGELVLVVAPPSDDSSKRPPVDRDALSERISELMRSGNIDFTSAIKRVAEEYGMSKNEVYREIIKHKTERREE
ncbi:MAG: 16S rRNA (cytidine(1402)-2'-O)-methyltransferase [Acidobacteria bacterium]|nr:MAG: 16S rRNA (cytidine(1402)-2'-O)-methyltransferase [Acidobacteriota bacterium]